MNVPLNPFGVELKLNPPCAEANGECSPLSGDEFIITNGLVVMDHPKAGYSWSDLMMMPTSNKGAT